MIYSFNKIKTWKYQLRCGSCGDKFISYNGNSGYCDDCIKKTKRDKPITQEALQSKLIDASKGRTSNPISIYK